MRAILRYGRGWFIRWAVGFQMEQILWELKSNTFSGNLRILKRPLSCFRKKCHPFNFAPLPFFWPELINQSENNFNFWRRFRPKKEAGKINPTTLVQSVRRHRGAAKTLWDAPGAEKIISLGCEMQCFGCYDFDSYSPKKYWRRKLVVILLCPLRIWAFTSDCMLFVSRNCYVCWVSELMLVFYSKVGNWGSVIPSEQHFISHLSWCVFVLISLQLQTPTCTRDYLLSC